MSRRNKEEDEHDDDDDSDGSDADNDDDDDENQKPKISMKTALTFFAVLTSSVFQIYTMDLYSDKVGEANGNLILSACFLTLFIAPFALIVWVKKEKYSNFRDIIDEMQGETDRLKGQNAELSSKIDGMETAVKQLGDIEEALSASKDATAEGTEALVRLVKEYNEVRNTQKVILKGNCLQQMVEIVLEAFQSSESEQKLDTLGVEHLLMGLSNVDGLVFDEVVVKKDILRTNQSLKDILAIVNVLSEKSKIGEDL